MGSRSLLVVILCAIAIASTSAPALSGSFQIDVTDGVDVPDRTVTFEGNDYVISEIARESVDGTIQVQTTAPSDAEYQLYLYNSDKSIVDSSKETGSATVSFDLSDLSHGTYMLTIYDGEYRAVHPVVIQGYTVGVTSPSEAEPGGEISVTVQVSPTAATGAPDAVKVILADADDTVRTTATHQSGTQYEAVVSLDGLEAGSYQLYAVAQGTAQAFGHQELLGVSDAQSVSIEDESGGGGGGGGQSSQTTIPEPTSTQNMTPTTTSDRGSTTASSTTPDETTAQTPTRTQTSTQSTTTDGNVITPAEPDTTERATTSSPGQDLPITLTLVSIAIACVGLYGTRQR